MYIYIHMYIHVYIHMYTYICIYIYMYMLPTHPVIYHFRLLKPNLTVAVVKS